MDKELKLLLDFSSCSGGEVLKIEGGMLLDVLCALPLSLRDGFSLFLELNDPRVVGERGLRVEHR